MNIYNDLKSIGIPVAYSHFKERQIPPYLIYIGSGQNQKLAENTIYLKDNHYRVEFYFLLKNETMEDKIETTFLNSGWLYEKSEDIYIEDEEIYMIYYSVRRK